MDVSVFDLVVLAFVGFLTYKGYKKGIILETTLFLGLVLGIWTCLNLTHVVMTMLQEHLTLSPNFHYVVYVLLFMLTFVAVQMVGITLERILALVRLNIFNALSGALLGLAKGIFIVSALVWISLQVNLFSNIDSDSSMIFPYVKDFAPTVISFLTENFDFMKDVIQEVEVFFVQITEKWQGDNAVDMEK